MDDAIIRQDWTKFDLAYLNGSHARADVFLGVTMSYPATDQFDPGYLAVQEANLTTIKLLGASRGKTEPALPYQLQLGRNMLHRLNVVDASEVPKRRQFWPFQALVSKKDPK